METMKVEDLLITKEEAEQLRNFKSNNEDIKKHKEIINSINLSYCNIKQIINLYKFIYRDLVENISNEYYLKHNKCGIELIDILNNGYLGLSKAIINEAQSIEYNKYICNQIEHCLYLYYKYTLKEKQNEND